MLFEKKWPSVILSPITIANHVVTVSDTYGLHPKQLVELTLGGNAGEFEVKRVLSKTQFQLGKVGTGIKATLNPTAFNGATLVASEQERNVIDANAGIRAAYAEEPTVALRTHLVDYYGETLGTAANPVFVTGDGGGGGGTAGVLGPNPLYVTVSKLGVAASVPTSATTSIIQYVVPMSKLFWLTKIEFSGDNVAEYTVKIDGVLAAKRRTMFGADLSGEFDFSVTMTAGLQVLSTVEVLVYHQRPSVGDFEARILGMQTV